MRSRPFHRISKKLFTITGCAFCILAICVSPSPLSAQQQQDGFAIRGLVNVEMRYYNNSKGFKTRPPFVLVLNALPEIRIGQWIIPTRILVGTYNKSYRDFNRFGISPRYKWITLHAGHTTLNWSRYVLDSRPVLGAGFELSPGKFRFGAFAGILNQAFEQSTYNSRIFSPQFSRKMVAARIGYVADDENAIELTALSAADNPHSLDSAKAVGLRDAANGTISLHIAKKLGKNLSIDALVGASAYTEQRNAGKDFANDFYAGKIPGYLTKTNASTIYAGAYSLSLKYRIKKSKKKNEVLATLDYERVDPGYQSMGLYYLINDIQRTRAGFQLHTSKQKLLVAANAGFENNNIKKTQLINNRRIIGGVTINYRSSPNWTWNASLMNYAVRLGIDRVNAADSLVVNQANRSATLSTQGSLGKGTKRKFLTAMAGYQAGKNIMGAVQTKLTYTYFDATYRLSPVNHTSFTPGFSINNYKTTSYNSTRYVPSLAADRTFKEKYNVRYTMYFIVTYLNSKYTSLGWQNALSGNWNISAKNSLSAYLIYQKNFAKALPFSELQLTVRYGIRF